MSGTKRKPNTKEHNRNISLAIRGNKHWGWKGEDASYSSKHKWIVRERGNPMACDNCGTTEKKWYDWANISQSYKRDFTDWMRLCRPCHWAYDHGKLKLK